MMSRSSFLPLPAMSLPTKWEGKECSRLPVQCISRPSNIYLRLAAAVFALGWLTEIIHGPFRVLRNRPPLIAFMKFNLDGIDRWTLCQWGLSSFVCISRRLSLEVLMGLRQQRRWGEGRGLGGGGLGSNVEGACEEEEQGRLKVTCYKLDKINLAYFDCFMNTQTDR